MSTKTYRVPNISCGHCVAAIEREIEAVPGVRAVKGDVDSKQVTVLYEDEAVASQVERVLEEIGYPAAN